MRLPAPLRVLPLAALVLAVPLRPDESIEPAQRFVLEVDGQPFEVVAGESFELRLGDTTHSAELRARPYKHLALAELEFDYPAHLTFEYEQAGGLEIWTLEGRDAVLMVYRFDQDTESEELLRLFAEGVRESFSDTKIAEETTTLRLGDRQAEGLRLTWELSGFENVQEVYVLDPTSPARRVLVLQDTVDPGEQDSAEFQALRGMLERTYVWKSQ